MSIWSWMGLVSKKDYLELENKLDLILENNLQFENQMSLMEENIQKKTEMHSSITLEKLSETHGTTRAHFQAQSESLKYTLEDLENKVRTLNEMLLVQLIDMQKSLNTIVDDNANNTLSLDGIQNSLNDFEKTQMQIMELNKMLLVNTVVEDLEKLKVR